MKTGIISLAVFLCGGFAFGQASETVAQHALRLAAEAPRDSASRHGVSAPNAYGSSETMDSYMAYSLQGQFPLNDQISADGNFNRWFVAGSGFFVGSIQLPAGAVIDAIGLDDCSANNNDFQVNIVDATGPTTYTFVGTGYSTVGCGPEPYLVSGLNYQTTNNSGHLLYWLILETGPTNGSSSLHGAYVSWHRAISPPPGSATFVDVPLGSPLSPFVEALVSAGITAGCDATHYCPTASLTRGQMAVYLATALGLNWPN
jgi:hypothetical protein